LKRLNILRKVRPAVGDVGSSRMAYLTKGFSNSNNNDNKFYVWKLSKIGIRPAFRTLEYYNTLLYAPMTSRRPSSVELQTLVFRGNIYIYFFLPKKRFWTTRVMSVHSICFDRVSITSTVFDTIFFSYCMNIIHYVLSSSIIYPYRFAAVRPSTYGERILFIANIGSRDLAKIRTYFFCIITCDLRALWRKNTPPMQ